jgi:dihydrofolate synthase/folylpolyglutamate synthase
VTLKEFLEAKPLYYDEIDYSRMPRVYEKIREFIKIPKIIHIIGTNGKGTTGRFLSNAICSKGFGVGHYTSPHILEFNERIWCDGANASDASLETAHKELQELLTSSDAESLSYFEYTTLLAMIIFKECEFVIMEAGLGGEHDATAVFDKILTLVTPIGYDHEAFLGAKIEQIAATKLAAIQKSAIVAKQNYEAVYQAAANISSEKMLNIYRVDEFIDDADRVKIQEISQKLSLAPYLSDNLTLSIAALKFLDIDYSVFDFKESVLFGRLSRISENIIVDVGHNALAASRVSEALNGDKFVLIYNSYKDKNYHGILSILKPLILHVEIIEIENQRVEDIQKIQEALANLKIENSIFKEIKKEQKYLVFGSFSVAEKFLKEHANVAKYTI